MNCVHICIFVIEYFQKKLRNTTESPQEVMKAPLSFFLGAGRFLILYLCIYVFVFLNCVFMQFVIIFHTKKRNTKESPQKAMKAYPSIFLEAGRFITLQLYICIFELCIYTTCEYMWVKFLRTYQA